MKIDVTNNPQAIIITEDEMRAAGLIR